MPGYIDPPLETDPGELAADALDYMTANIPGYVPYEGQLDVWLINALARMVAEARDVASRVPTSIFRFFGKSILRLAPIEAVSAAALSTWTMKDALGYTVLAGTVIARETSGDTSVPFRTMADFTVPPGQTTIANIPVEAVEPGVAGNGIAAGSALPVDALEFISSIATTTTSSGGVDAETDEEYLDRLAAELELLTPRPVLPADFAVMARRVAGVERAVAIDGFNPADGTLNNERMVAVAVVDSLGNPLGTVVKDSVKSDLQARREINFVVNVIDPTYTAIDVTVTVKAKPGYDAAALDTAIENALNQFFSPARWAGGNEDPPVWRDEKVVRYLEVAEVINQVEGVAFITTTGGLFDLLVEGGRADVTMAGTAPLPTVGVIAAVVT